MPEKPGREGYFLLKWKGIVAFIFTMPLGAFLSEIVQALWAFNSHHRLIFFVWSDI
jgi:hypothetical protein